MQNKIGIKRIDRYISVIKDIGIWDLRDDVDISDNVISLLKELKKRRGAKCIRKTYRKNYVM